MLLMNILLINHQTGIRLHYDSGSGVNLHRQRFFRLLPAPALAFSVLALRRGPRLCLPLGRRAVYRQRGKRPHRQQQR